MKPFIINPDFQNLIPPLSDDELRGLEESILSYGRCRDTIKIWNGIIIDGHNRYAICQKHSIPYSVQDMHFTSKKNAELWIIENQLGRRNLTNAMRIKLVLHKENLLREEAKQNRRGSKGRPMHVRKVVAKEANVGETTVYKYMKIRQLGTPELLRKVEAGEIKIGTAYRGLEVTTRTVERLFEAEGDLDISDPRRRMSVLGNIDKLEKFVGFVSDNIALVATVCDVLRVRRRFKGQLRVVEGLLH